MDLTPRNRVNVARNRCMWGLGEGGEASLALQKLLWISVQLYFFNVVFYLVMQVDIIIKWHGASIGFV